MLNRAIALAFKILLFGASWNLGAESILVSEPLQVHAAKPKMVFTLYNSVTDTIVLDNIQPGSTVNASSLIDFNLKAKPSNMSIDQVRFGFHNGATHIDSTSPYFACGDTGDCMKDKALTGTTVKITARGYKKNVAVGELFHVFITLPPQLTQVEITSPANNTTFTSAQTVTILANAANSAAVQKVEFYDGGVLQHTDLTAPYAFDWGISEANNGTHQWTAKAIDKRGGSLISAPVSLIVDISAEMSISITDPPNDTTYTSEQIVPITATVFNPSDVDRVEFFAGGLLQFTDTSVPYRYNWVVHEGNNGTHIWTAKVYTTTGITLESDEVALHVNVPPALCRPIVAHYDSVQSLLEDTTLSLSSFNSGKRIQAGEQYYKVASAAAMDHQFVTLGGLKLYVASAPNRYDCQ